MKKVCALFLTLVMVCSALPLSFAVMITGISYEPMQKQYFYETEGEWRTDGGGNDYFHYNISFNIGDTFTEQLSDGSADHYTCEYNEEEHRMEFVNVELSWDVITLDRLEIVDTQEDSHWTLGENTYEIDMGGKRYTVTVSVVENPVESIYYEPQNSSVFIEEAGGEWSQRENGETYYRYHLDMVHPGDTLYVRYTDGRETAFTAYYDEQADNFYFESEEGERLEYGRFGVYCFDEQEREPFQVGSDNYYHVVYSGRYHDIAVTLDPNPVQAISYEPRHEKKLFFEGDGRWETDDYGSPYFHYNIRFLEEGDILRVINVYDEEIAYTAKWDEQSREMYFENDEGDTIAQNEINFYDEQHRSPFTLGGENEYHVVYSGREYRVPVSIVENTVATITYTPKKPIVVYLNTDGQWETDAGGESYFRYFGATRTQDGDILTITDTEGVSTAYVAKWNEQRECREYISAGGAVIEDQEVRFTDEQYQTHYVLGSQNYFYVEYAGKRASVPVTVANNPVSAVTFIPAQSALIYENSGGNWETDAQGTQWYNYSIPGFREGDILKVTFTESGETVAYTYTYDEQTHTSFFADSLGNALENEDNLYLSRTGRWSLGDDNTYHVVYFEVESNPISVSIVQSPIQLVEYLPAREKVCYFENDGEWDTDDAGQPYYRYHYTQIESGDILRVTDAQGVVTDYTAQWDENTYTYSFLSEGGECIEENRVSFFDEQHRTPFVLGDENAYYVEYMGKQAVVPVKVLASPLSGISYVPQQAIVLYEQTNGYWTTDNDGNPFFYYFCQRIRTGDSLILTYPDSTTKTFTAVWDDEQERFVFVCGQEQIDENDLDFFDKQYEEPFTPGSDNVIYLGYLGQTCTVPVSVEANPVKAVEFIPVDQASYIENTHGHWETDEGGQSYFEYEMPGWHIGDMFKVTASDGGITLYTFCYDEEAGYTWFFDASGNTLDGTALYYEHDDTVPWTVGAQNEYWFTYFGVASNRVSVQIVPNPVKAITYTPVKPAEYLENSNGYWDDTAQLYWYNTPSMRPGDVLTITDNNNVSTAYTFTQTESGDRYFLSAGGERIDADEVRFESYQYDIPWTLGDQNEYTVEYCGITTSLYVTIVENNVLDIAFVPAQPIVIDEGTGGRYYAQEYLYIYDIPVSTGDILKVTYKNGDITDYVFDKENMTLKSADGKEIDVQTISLYSTQYMRQWAPGEDNVFYVEYAGIEKEVPLTIRKRFAESTVAPTCTAWGYTEHTGGDSIVYRTNYVPALGHDFSLMIANESTKRTDAGSAEGTTYYYTCARCGALSTQNDMHFSLNAGTIVGFVQQTEREEETTLRLYKGEECVAATTTYGGGLFQFCSIEPGAYTIVLGGVGVLADQITGLNVRAGETLDLRESSDAAVRSIAVRRGDVNRDGSIDIADISAMLAEGVYGADTADFGYNDNMDLNANGVIDMPDIGILLEAQNYAARARVLTY